MGKHPYFRVTAVVIVCVSMRALNKILELAPGITDCGRSNHDLFHWIDLGNLKSFYVRVFTDRHPS